MPGSECRPTQSLEDHKTILLLSCGHHLSDPRPNRVDGVKLPKALAHRFNAEVRI
ncbi:MAG: hypothetical protein WB581_01600 [Halobacteriota archaeon]